MQNKDTTMQATRQARRAEPGTDRTKHNNTNRQASCEQEDAGIQQGSRRARSGGAPQVNTNWHERKLHAHTLQICGNVARDGAGRGAKDFQTPNASSGSQLAGGGDKVSESMPRWRLNQTRCTRVAVDDGDAKAPGWMSAGHPRPANTGRATNTQRCAKTKQGNTANHKITRTTTYAHRLRPRGPGRCPWGPSHPVARHTASQLISRTEHCQPRWQQRGRTNLLILLACGPNMALRPCTTLLQLLWRLPTPFSKRHSVHLHLARQAESKQVPVRL